MPALHPFPFLQGPRVVTFARRCFITLVPAFIFVPSLCQQLNRTDSISTSLSSVYQHYANRIDKSAAIYKGTEYEGSYQLVEGTPFWDSSDFQPGAICYQGIIYYDIPMAYDLVRNELLVLGPQPARLLVDATKIDSFFLKGHSFVYVRNDSSHNALTDGIYDRLFNTADLKVYAARYKIIAAGTRAEEPEHFTTHARYYLQYDHSNYTLTRSADLLHIFPDEKSRLRAFWRANKMNYKKDPESFILKTVDYWLQLRK
jgi:hypothetical protein